LLSGSTSSALPDFLEGLAPVPDELARALAAPVFDHHVHGCFARSPSRQQFERTLNEGSIDPIPDFLTQFDSQLGFAVRRWCAPLLGLPPSTPADEYWAARSAVSAESVSRIMLDAAGVRCWLVDTGFGADMLTAPDVFANWSGGAVREVLRLESLAESLLLEGLSPPRYAESFRALLAERGGAVVGTKSIAAYRCGFVIDWAEPDAAAVAAEVRRCLRGGDVRLTSPLLISFGVHAAARAGLPIQFHVGLGDRDLDLARVDPLQLSSLLVQPHVRRVPVLLLHCYPYHRQAGYLAQAFENVYCDVGLAVNHLGARSVELVAESLELAPFAKQLYSSDAWGAPELHLLGSVLWRRALAQVLGRWVAQGDWSAGDAGRVVRMIGAGNAERVYGLSAAPTP
jgi:uncharacterized protein